MTNHMLSPTRQGLAALALAAIGLTLAAHPAKAQPYYADQYDQDAAYTTEDVIVVAPRTVGRSAIGAPIEQVRASRVINISDLDLDTDWGVRALKHRVRWAARAACDELDARYPITVDSGEDCYRDAVRRAMIRAEDITGYDLAER